MITLTSGQLTVTKSIDIEGLGRDELTISGGNAGRVFAVASGSTPIAANTAVTVYWKDGKVAVTDGPYAETKEQLGGIQVLEARDLNHAIQLISQSPGVKLKCGTIEIRPAADINEIMRESERRRKETSP